jgi:hypothetical protein
VNSSTLAEIARWKGVFFSSEESGEIVRGFAFSILKDQAERSLVLIEAKFADRCFVGWTHPMPLSDFERHGPGPSFNVRRHALNSLGGAFQFRRSCLIMESRCSESKVRAE